MEAAAGRDHDAARLTGGPAPALWLLVARTGGLLAVAGVGAASVWPGAAIVVVGLAAVLTVPDLRDQATDVGHRADRREAFPAVVAAAGGRSRLVACQIHTAPAARPLVAWELDIDMLGIDRPPKRPDVVIRMWPNGGGPLDPALDTSGYRFLARVPGWEAWAGCQ